MVGGRTRLGGRLGLVRSWVVGVGNASRTGAGVGVVGFAMTIGLGSSLTKTGSGFTSGAFFSSTLASTTTFSSTEVFAKIGVLSNLSSGTS